MARIVAFGDSLTANETYLDVPDQSWIQQMARGLLPHGILDNFAEGGSVSGQGDHYVYQMNGVTLQTMGLLGQIQEYLSASYRGDVHVIWSGINDLVIGAQLDPFTTAAGVKVTATSLVTEFRETFIGEQLHTDDEYLRYVVSNYLAVNIDAAIGALREAGIQKIIVIGFYPLQVTGVGQRASVRKRALTATLLGNDALRSVCQSRNVVFVDLEDMDPTFIDEIHLDHKAQTEVLKRIYMAALTKDNLPDYYQTKAAMQ